MTGPPSMVGDESNHYNQHYEDDSSMTHHNTGSPVAGLDENKGKYKQVLVHNFSTERQTDRA